MTKTLTRRRALPVTARVSMAVWASAAWSRGKVCPMTGRILPAAASASARAARVCNRSGVN
jgi:hypothetical protein